MGTPLATTSDAEGHFSFRKMEAGKYNLEFSMFSFDTKIISEVEVINGEATTLTVSLSEKNNVLDEVVIRTVKAKVESISSLLTVQKNSVRVSDGISAESIKKTPDRTASDVLKRISGASIQNNKFVIIRGLNDRYNTTYLNGSPLPSTVPDRKAFSFDIFPSNMLDNMVIYKTASADLPGEFAGGVIDINTKATPDKNFQSIAIGAGFNTLTTGKTQLVTTLPLDIANKKNDNFTPKAPLFSKVITVSYSSFDRFDIPKKTSEFNYVYCGLKDANGNRLDEDQLILRFNDSYSKIIEQQIEYARQ